ncbi:DNA-binding protein SMUBP-2-like [Diadema antillarum]|uniref:DNA-binding protein SMUBP-2-like n=1 Tax=Diadema antillarum TaxID=105358 RepID=UPI003A8B9DA0
MAVREFVAKHLELLNLERQAEVEQTSELLGKLSTRELERRGICLLKLHVASQATGLYGRAVLTFEPLRVQGQEGKLPAHNFGSGDIAGVSVSNSDTTSSSLLASGIVSKVTATSIAVAFEENVEGLSRGHDVTYKLTKLANDVTYRRLKRALHELDEYRAGPAVRLIEVLYGEGEIGSPMRLPAPDGNSSEGLKYFNQKLNESQREAVTFALGQREVAVIHGPPGTGKTTTVVEVILQAVQQGMKVLACAPSNVAVDNLVERLAAVPSCRPVRLGHPARLLPTIQRFALDAVLATSDGAAIVRDIRRDIDGALSQMRKTKDKDERYRLRDDVRFLRKDLKSREQRAIRDILTAADVVLATNTSASASGPLGVLDQGHFDLVVIDECAQSLEAACWIPLLSAPRCLLAGDHRQLPATIMSQKAAEEGLATSLMERIIDLHGNRVVRMLTMQYRMNDSIMQWSSDQLYDGKLESHETVAGHLLKDLPGVEENENTNLALLLIDTAGCDITELELEEEVSKGNEGEADLVAHHVDNLITSGLTPAQVCVIAPYNLQVDLLRLRLSGKYPGLEIKSVDGFQGREKEAVVISLVRSNDRGEVGFLTEDRRINVAITRARRHLAVICDSETVGKHAFLRSLLDYMTEHGEVRTAFEYEEVLESGSSAPRPDHLVFKSKRPASSPSSSKSAGARPKDYRGGQQRQRHEKGKGQSSVDPAQRSKEDATFRNEVKRRLAEFRKETAERIVSFPTSLNSHQRFVVHEIAEGLGLFHVSTGVAADRHIVVTKEKGELPAQPERVPSQAGDVPPPSSNGCADTNLTVDLDVDVEEFVTEVRTENVMENLSDEDKENEECVEAEAEERLKEASVEKAEMEGTKENVREGAKEESDKPNSDLRKCQYCPKKLPPGNLLLHEIRCEKIREEKERQNSATAGGRRRRNRAETKAKQKHSLEDAKEEEDFDALVALAVERDNRCNFVRCREKIALTGQGCPHCAKRYCFRHHVPEVHGCEEAARAHVRHQTLKAGVVTNGSGGPREKRVDPAHRANLQKKMERRLGQLGEQRQRKQKKK